MIEASKRIPDEAVVVRGGRNRPEDIERGTATHPSGVPKVFADFHNADPKGRLRLNCIGTVEDLSRQQVILQEGVQLVLYSEDLEVDGEVLYSAEESLWVAVIDWDAIREVEDEDRFVEHRKTA